MKFLFTLFLFFGLSIIANGQDFPKYYIQSGDTIGVIYSINQAQKIYNDQVLLELFKDMRVSCDTLVKKYLVVVNKYEQKQVINKNLIEQYVKIISDKDAIISEKQTKIGLLETSLKKSDDQTKIKDDEVKDYEKLVKQLKRQRTWLLGSTIGFGVLSIFFGGAALIN